LDAGNRTAGRQPRCGRRHQSELSDINRRRGRLNTVSTLTYGQSRDFHSRKPEGILMLHYAIVFFIIALIAALFGFGGIAAGAAGIAKILFVVFLICAVVALLVGPRRI
jgi:uncharacterized membrane protein YtjA (UPF0391 family)